MTTFTTPPEFLRIRELQGHLGISRSTLMRLRDLDGFPEPNYLGSSPVWARTTMNDWVNTQSAPVDLTAEAQA